MAAKFPDDTKGRENFVIADGARRSTRLARTTWASAAPDYNVHQNAADVAAIPDQGGPA